MKTNLLKTFGWMMGAMLLVAGFAVATPNAFAANTTLNGASNDCPTAMVANHTTQVGASSPCWGVSVSATPGQTVNVRVYYHNSGNDVAKNVRVRLVKNSSAGNHAFTAYVMADNAVPVSGSATINVSPATPLTFDRVVIARNQSQNGVPVANGSDIFSAQGILVGDIAPGWNTQGAVIATYQIPNNQPPQTYACSDGTDNDGDGHIDMNDPGCSSTTDNDEYNQVNNNIQPSAMTLGASGVGETYATLNGTYNLPSYGLLGGGTRFFQWGTSASNLNYTTQVNGQIVGSGSHVEQITGLTPGQTYYFRMVAQATNGQIAYGQTLSFTALGGQVNPILSVTTNSATNVTESSALLNGYYTYYQGSQNSSQNVSTFFKYGLSTSFGQTTSYDSSSSNSRSFSQSITGLQANRTYYYQACAVAGGVTQCGNTQSFSTSTAQVQLTAITLPPTSVGQTNATLNGSFTSSDSNNVSVFYEYGTTQSLGNRTNAVNRSGSNGSAQISINGLSSNTRYYYRVVVESNGQTAYGSILNFSTLGSGVTPTPQPPVQTGNGSLVRLFITNNQDQVFMNETVTYEVEYENVSRVDLEDVVIRVEFPRELRFVSSTAGSYSDSDNAITVKVEELEVGERDDFTVTLRVVRGAREGELLVATAVLAYENPTQNEALENAIAFDADPYQRPAALGASIFGAGFFPTTFIGWLILILIIVLVVLAARFLYKNMKEKNANNNDAGTPPNEYRPYRPTPRS